MNVDSRDIEIHDVVCWQDRRELESNLKCPGKGTLERQALILAEIPCEIPLEHEEKRTRRKTTRKKVMKMSRVNSLTIGVYLYLITK